MARADRSEITGRRRRRSRSGSWLSAPRTPAEDPPAASGTEAAAAVLRYYHQHVPGQALLGWVAPGAKGRAGLRVACFGQPAGDEGGVRYTYVTLGFGRYEAGYSGEPDGRCGWGHELLLHIESEEAAPQGDTAPLWPVELLDNLLHYVQHTGLCFQPGDHSRYDGFPAEPFAGLLYGQSPLLPGPLALPCGRLGFLDAMPVTAAELDLARRWDVGAVVAVLREAGLLPWARCGRACLTDPQRRAEIYERCEARAAVEGSTTGVLAFRGELSLGPHLHTRCTVHPEYTTEVRAGLRRRLMHGRSLVLESYPRGAARRDFALVFEPVVGRAAATMRWDTEGRVLRIDGNEAALHGVATGLLRSLDGPPSAVPFVHGALLLCGM